MDPYPWSFVLLHSHCHDAVNSILNILKNFGLSRTSATHSKNARISGNPPEQTRDYNHVQCATCIEKIVSHHGWDKLKIRSPPPPMKSDSKFQADIQTSRGPESIKEQKVLEKRMGFSYQQTIGELIYALTVCRVDISIAVITLSQHSHHPAQIHYEAVKQVWGLATDKQLVN
jgi:hypothetical protein